MTRTSAALVALVAALLMLAARATGPAESWDNSQPRTMAGTIGLLEHGRWILPIEDGVDPLRKPPLYNWLAAPMVALLGPDSAFAHKWPSTAAALVLVLAIVRVAERVAGDLALGALGAVLGAATFMFAKLGWLARPDMLLTAALVVGWACATIHLVDPPARAPRAGFWTAVAVAALAKGPPVVLLLAFAAVAPRLLGRPARLGWAIGLPLALAPAAAWMGAVAWIDPDFAWRVLVGEEVVGRVTGLGPEGSQGGLRGWVLGLPDMVFYALTRYAPASVLAVPMAAWLLRRAAPGGPRRWRTLGDAGLLLASAALFAGIVVGAFSLSEGKRADYIAATIAPFGLLAAGLVLGVPRGAPMARSRARRVAAVAVPAAAVLANIVVLQRTSSDPSPGFGRAIDAFVAAARPFVAVERERVVFDRVGRTHLRAALGFSEADVDSATLRERLRAGETLLIVGGSTPEEVDPWPERIRERCPDFPVAVETVLEGPTLAAHSGWPGRVDLVRAVRVDPLAGFIARAWARLDPERDRVAFRGLQHTTIPAALGFDPVQLDGPELRARLRNHGAVLVVAGGSDDDPESFAAWVARRAPRFEVRVELVLEGTNLPRLPGWPERLDVYRVERLDAQVSPSNLKG